MRLLLMTCFALILPLAACGSGETRAAFRQRQIDECISAAQSTPHPGAPPDFDWRRLCGCTVDRYLVGKRDEDLGSLPHADPALRAARQQCLAEQLGMASPGP